MSNGQMPVAGQNRSRGLPVMSANRTSFRRTQIDKIAVYQALTKRDRVYLRTGLRNIMRVRFCRELGKIKTNVLTLVLVLLVIIFVGVHFGRQPWTPTRIAGEVIGLPSLALLVLARIQLGGSFSVRPKAQALVTHGLYSRFRNPIYLFGALAIAGIFLYMNQPLYLWLFVVLIPLQIYRTRQEEKVLEARFGDEYRQYKSDTWF
jgi:protein-S-isoprenylcysteine O-methyltransferase Ste14